MTAPATPGPIRVLVVDDEESIADLLAMALRFEGCEVTTALRAALSCC